MTVEILAVVGLLLGATLYALLIRRRGGDRLEIVTMSRALSASNEVALERIRNAPRDRAGALEAIDERLGDGVIVYDRRTGGDRRSGAERSRGRGRRTGGDRRRGHRH